MGPYMGDPVHSLGLEVAANKCNSKEAAMMNRRSDLILSVKQLNDCGGKDCRRDWPLIVKATESKHLGEED